MTKPESSYRFLGWITVLVITFQLISDATAGKIIGFFGFSVSITVLYFPVTYIFSDVLTEVYGYAPARSVLWKSMAASILAGLVYQLAAYLPAAEGFPFGQSYQDVFGSIPRILIGGWLAVFTGEISNNYVMARMKLLTNGKAFWLRALGSTLIGQLVNTSVFYAVALSGVLPTDVLIEAIVAGWMIKTIVEAILLPLTYVVCGFLKKAEGIDAFDRGTNFNPFILGK